MKNIRKTISIIIIVITTLLLLISCTKGKKYETVDSMKSGLTGTYKSIGSKDIIIISDKEIISFNYDSVFRKPTRETDEEFSDFFEKNFLNINYSNLTISDYLNFDFVKINRSDANFDTKRSRVNDIFVKDSGEILTSKKNGEILEKLSSDYEFPSKEMLNLFNEYKVFLIDYEIKRIAKESVEKYNEKKAELESIISPVNKRSPASEDTVASCAWQQIKEILKDPYSAVLVGYSDVEYDSYGRVYCKIVYRAKNSYGAYVAETKYIVLQSCTYGGIYKYNPYSFYASSESMVKSLNNWDKDPDSDNNDYYKEEDYKKAINYINSNKYNLAIKLLKSLGSYRKSQQIMDILNDIMRFESYNESIELYKSGDYGKAKGKLSWLDEEFMDSKRLRELYDIVKNQKQYSEAYTAISTGDYEKAKNLFSELGNYSDSKLMAEKCTEMMYISAVNFFNEGSYTEALIILEKLGDYKNVKQLIEECNDRISAVPDTELNEAETTEEEDLETKALESQPPETEPPETKAPETDPPETKAPETKTSETDPPETKVPETEPQETKVPETEPQETGSIETEPVITSHIHTDACLKWVVDIPYSPAVYENQKVIDIPYSPAEYGDIPYEMRDCYYKVKFYSYFMEPLVFSSTEKFEEWFEESGAVINNPNLNGGYVEINGSTEYFWYEEYDYYYTVKYKYGIIKPEQPEVSHLEKVLVTPEQKEEGHFEYICGY